MKISRFFDSFFKFFTVSTPQRVFTYYSLPIAILTLGIRTIGHYTLPVYDDAFITFRYAKNLVEGFGFVYNPHEWVLGLTTPGFGLFSALIYALHFALPNTT